ncbi:TPA: DUF551 domain-containing protein [Klebsiella quasipneumoniae subsp. similipneumoniae]
MTKSTITRERLEEIVSDPMINQGSEFAMMARMALSAMDSESWCLPLDYLQGHKDGLEWASQLAEANHPETGDWLYDDPIELAKAIRKGPDMPPVQPVADSEPVAEVLSNRPGNDTSTIDRAIPVGTQLYRHAQPAPVVPEEITSAIEGLKQSLVDCNRYNYCFDAVTRVENACRAAMLQAEPVCTCPSGNGSLRWPCPVHPGNNPEIPDAWIPVSEQMPEIGDIVLTSMGGVVNVGETECSAANCRFFTSVISGRELPATHWMPLPAGPQEGK